MGNQYRKQKGTDTWHFCSNCSTWPTSNYEASSEKPTEGALCNECKAKKANNSCQ
jgi:hypothetical protein